MSPEWPFVWIKSGETEGKESLEAVEFARDVPLGGSSEGDVLGRCGGSIWDKVGALRIMG